MWVETYTLIGYIINKPPALGVSGSHCPLPPLVGGHKTPVVPKGATRTSPGSLLLLGSPARFCISVLTWMRNLGKMRVQVGELAFVPLQEPSKSRSWKCKTDRVRSQ